MSPPYVFRIDEIGEPDDALAHFDNQGNWKPSTDAGANRFIGGGVSGRHWYCDGQKIYEIPSRPSGCHEYKRFSVYFVGGVGFWVLKGDATRPPDDDVWHPLRFDHHPTDYSSFLTNAGQHSTLRVQRHDQRWPALLLPDIYHTSVRTPYQTFGGLTGELPIFLALLAFSTHRDYLYNVLPTVFSGGAWVAHQYGTPRSNQRGVVVTVYTSPRSTAADLDHYERGYLGKYFN